MSESRLSPAALRERIQRTLRRLPPVQFADERLQQVENDVLQGLKTRLQALEDPVQHEGMPVSLHALLELSMEQSVEQAQAMLIHRCLQNLTGDEARLLAAMGEGDGFPLLTVNSGSLWSSEQILHRHSNIGRAAGIQCHGAIALYLARLFAQGLVISSAESDSLRTDYELCEGDSDFRKAVESLKRHTPKLKVRRETLRISPMGMSLWGLMTYTDQVGGA